MMLRVELRCLSLDNAVYFLREGRMSYAEWLEYAHLWQNERAAFRHAGMRLREVPREVWGRLQARFYGGMPMMIAVRREYERLRRKGWTANDAFRAAKVAVAWASAEAEGLVRIVCEPECEPHDDSYIDTWGLQVCDVKREKADLWRTIERDGLWVYASQYRLTEDHPWETADSIGDCVGDIRDCGYDVDMKRAALDALDAARDTEASKLAERATFAMV